MMKLVVVVVALAVSTPAFARGVPTDRVPGVALVKLKGIDGHHLVVDASALGAIGKRAGVELTLKRPIALGWAMLSIKEHGVVPDETETLNIVERLASDPAVAAASPDKWMRALRTPNDPGFSQMWHFQIINAEQAWDVTVGDSSQRIGIVDTGILRNHEDVGSRAVAGFDFISDPGTANDGDGRDADFNDAGDSCNGQQSSFHGTHVAGTIGATANNGTGVVGLNWNAGLVIARALGVCGGDLADIAEGAIWLAGGHVDNVPDNTANKVSVINLSLGSDSQCSSFEQQAVDFANQNGVMFVAAAGNSGLNLGQSNSVGSPANCTGAIAVGAHGPQHELADYSSFGPEIAIVAPGGDEANFGQAGGVLSTIGPVTNGYTFDEGTSMATPHVTGSISLMQALNPSLTRDQIVSILQQTGTQCSNCGGKVALVLDAALHAVPAPTSTNPPPTNPPPSQDDAFEENDSFAQAAPGLVCNQQVALFAAPADQDYFLLPTSAGESIDVNIHSENGADLDLYALSGPTANDIVATSNGNTGDEAIHIDGDGSTLAILVDPFVDPNTGTQNSGPYTLLLACSGAPPPSSPPPSTTPPGDGNPPPSTTPPTTDDSLEPNNTIAQASQVFCDEDVPNLVSADDDFYKVDVRDGDTLTARVTSATAVTAQILSTSGDVLGEGDAHDFATAADLAAGTYVVKISPSANGAGSYELLAKCAPASKTVVRPASSQVGCSASGAQPAFLAVLGVLLLRVRRRR